MSTRTIGRIPNTLEKYRHALSGLLEEYEQRSQHSHAPPSPPPSFLNPKGDDDIPAPSMLSSSSDSPLPDHQSRIDDAHKKVRVELNLLVSNISWISDDLHGDLQLIRSNINLMSSHSLNPKGHSHRLPALANIREQPPPTASTTVSPFPSTAPSDGNAPVLDPQQTKSMQHTVSILQAFIENNSAMVDYIQLNQQRLDALWVVSNIPSGPLHQLHSGLS